ncbi:RsmB/NOP family class I SAM-dependent RNA methyltransferase [Haloferula sargassicola]|uniref:Ribosomal RNA small subunit methyltransferase B n=1 Tax=Haloferula sargassicola TaxID=490096 RepID=A0ABP9UTY4_9BACT
MRWHRVLTEACGELLSQVFDHGRVLDHVVAAAFQAQRKWGKRDRSFVAETVWEVVRWRRALAFVAGSEDPRALLAAHWIGREGECPPDWRWQRGGTEEMIARRAALADQPRAIRESVPDWLDERGFSEMGPSWDRELAALNGRAPVFLRVNTLLADRAAVLDWLRQEKVAARPVDGLPDAVVLEGLLPKRLVGDGRIEIQDAGSQAIVPLLDLEPGMRVIDACAGAGGKTLHLAAAMAGQGEIVALDVAGRKLDELRRRARGAHVRHLSTEKWDAGTLRKFRGWADRVLIDAPCSGLGTLRRQPDLKWRLTEPGLEKTRRTQRKLLDHYPELLRPGGKWVYATCSVLPSENRGQIDALLERDPRWQVEDERIVSPAETGWDGFYAARLSGAAR